MLPLGTPLPQFTLSEPRTGKSISSSDLNEKPLLLVAFICNHCPYVIHLKEAFVALVKDYQPNLQALAISSNSPETHPQDGPEAMAEDAEKYHYPFPYCFDQDQKVAPAFRAACTPEFYLFNAHRKLIYRGQFDDTRPHHRTAPDNDAKGSPPTGQDLRRAIDLALDGKQIPDSEQKPSLGCNIKWAPGNEPDYS